ncbi:MAG: prepilin peptidase [Sphingomonas sp.]|nr:prepilin peptidase [Sphingomonas sp.]
MPNWGRVVLLGILGAVFGSFIAALVIRWPAGRSVMRGRSACDACGRVLRAHELVPLVSALASGGKCRTCAAPIDPAHWRIEAVAVLIGVSAAMALPGGEALAAAVLGWLLLALAAIDAREFWLPDELTLVLALGGVASGLLGVAPGMSERLIGGAAGFGALWAIGAGYRLLRGRDGLGGGDPKLLGAIGLWTGWALLPVIVFVAALAGLGVALFWTLTGRGVRGDDRLPLGTLMAIAAYPALVIMLAMTP